MLIKSRSLHLEEIKCAGNCMNQPRMYKLPRGDIRIFFPNKLTLNFIPEASYSVYTPTRRWHIDHPTFPSHPRGKFFGLYGISSSSSSDSSSLMCSSSSSSLSSPEFVTFHFGERSTHSLLLIRSQLKSRNSKFYWGNCQINILY